MNGQFPANSFAASLGLPESSGSLLHADWPAPSNVHTWITTRQGGVSQGRFASLNVGDHVGDDLAAVAENRRRVQAYVPLPLVYLRQVHGNRVVHAADYLGTPPEADAAFDRSRPADCLPVLLCDRAGSVVAAAHAGWRGLAGGVLENTIAAMQADPADLLAWLGPAIGPDAFEVGGDVLAAFTQADPAAEAAFEPIGSGKYLANIYLLATQTLRRAGVSQIYGGQHCTVLERDRFFSYRRDGQTGRMVSTVWLSPE